ncbi:type II toxin-antitoxin system HipA family toxin [Gelidibacter salicanalis]|uniref:Type II toxin-antitoxin system HipA family toxin n=1 Tax=Gelidibacter salicanalis TaxID=291193 RepID=A0A934NI99_9FLAO|nr:type II toxin-antitoxin system HipA family toxin [Gelidibacter salicanalis]MBJ7879839.1 type II toxin-antitoxin system HipA family toxin [Gelidibacter salicanalis]
MVDVAEIKLWGEMVGAVRWDAQNQLASFQYSPAFLQKQWEISPIKMPTTEGSRIFSFPELRKGKNDNVDTFKGLPGLLADALPDRYGNQLINLWLAKNGRPADSMNPVEQLCFIGTRAMGALEFEPAQLTSQNSFDIEISSLVEAAHKTLSKKEQLDTNLNDDEEKALMEVLKVGISAGGARPKAVIAYNEKTGAIKSGQTNVPKGFEHWLLKLDGVSDAQFGETHGWGRVEYAYYLMAKDAGITMMECKLLEENGRAHFMTKRFDRDGNTKHHIQTWCGIQHYDYNNLQGYSYEQLFQTMRALRLPYPEAEEMFRRMVFNVLATNYEDHTKNFSFRLKQGKSWELSPAYDVCYSYDPTNIWVSQHTLSINGKHKQITQGDLMTIAKVNNIKKGEAIIKAISKVVVNWNSYAKKANVKEQLTQTIAETHLQIH